MSGALEIREVLEENERLRVENARLDRLLNSPEIGAFVEGARREAAHQIERWGTAHDRGKDALDWFWLIGYLAGKAARADLDGDSAKALHHCISTAAVCANWHAHISERP